MKQLKLSVFVLVLLIADSGFSFIYVCGNHTGTNGVTSMQCFAFSGKCDDEKNLAGLGELFPAGWMCAASGLAIQDTGNVHLVSANDGGAYVVVKGERTPVGSDAFLVFVNRMQREKQNRRVNTKVMQDQFDAFLDADSGFVSDARMRELSAELGVPIEYEGSSRPRAEPGTGRGSASAVSNANSSARQPDECSLPDCSCRVVSASGDSLCEGGTEEETAAGVHYCKCGKFGASTAQTSGAGGDFTIGVAGAADQKEREGSDVNSVVISATPEPAQSSIDGIKQRAQRQQVAPAAPPTPPTSQGQVPVTSRRAASSAIPGGPDGVQRFDAHEAAILLCRDVEMYGRSRQVATSAGARPPFSSVKPLCSIPDIPQRIQNYYCEGAGPGTGVFIGKCADSWWDSFWYGYSYCYDLKAFCEGLGAKWSTQ